MDPITIGAVLLAVVTGVSETLGGRLWAGVVSLIRRPVHRKATLGGDTAAVPSGEAELEALQRAPRDQQKALALAELLLARANADDSFKQALANWWKQAEPSRTSISNSTNIGDVTSTISGGTQYGPVLQARDLSGNLTFGASPAPPPNPPKDTEAG
jgi:hypothetical protein